MTRSQLSLAIAAFVAGILFSLYLLPSLFNQPLLPVAQLPDGGVYRGQLVDGQFQGQGVMEWPNGDSYRGGFSQGRFSGRGTMESEAGYRYQGDYSAGMPEGQGKIRFIDKSSYQGGMSRGLLHGSGSFNSAYEQYTGEFVDNYYEGSGSVAYTDGARYSGQFKAGQFHGQGQYIDKVGNTYNGEFHQGAFSGEGSWSGVKGDQYVGQFDNWFYQGRGLYTSADGSIYDGQFDKGEFSGEGKQIDRSGAHYEGSFKSWRFDGHGQRTNVDGDRYSGKFRAGFKHGEGRYEYAQPVDGISEFEAVWRWGEIVETEHPTLLINDLERLETALYSQDSLLEQQFAALAASTEAVELYVLAVAGDGTQRVFRREVDYLRQLASDNFQAASRTLVLANSKHYLGQYPLATRTSLERSLEALAQRMGPEDILFLYMTSHGSEDHQFSLQLKGLRLPDISAQVLAQLLRSAAIEWKVVVVSACYSGGFIPPLANDKTLVMTAAASDKASFGCSDDAQFTYFGRALLEQSLAETDSFVAAFEQAKNLVSEWEKEREITPSEPQIYTALPILKQLQRWRAGFSEVAETN